MSNVKQQNTAKDWSAIWRRAKKKFKYNNRITEQGRIKCKHTWQHCGEGGTKQVIDSLV